MIKKIVACLLLTVCIHTYTFKAAAQKKTTLLNHIALYVVDLDKSASFYKNIILLDTIPEPFHDGKHVWFKIGDHCQLHLIKGAKEIVDHDKNTHICFSVPSLDEFIAHLEKSNISYANWAGDGKTPTLRPDGVRQVYFQDPDGFWLEVNNDKY